MSRTNVLARSEVGTRLLGGELRHARYTHTEAKTPTAAERWTPRVQSQSMGNRRSAERRQKSAFNDSRGLTDRIAGRPVEGSR
jgi:hypothetical protein